MNVFELFAVLTLNKDDYEKGLNDTEQKSKGWVDKLKGLLQNQAVVAWMAVGKAILEVGKKINQLMLDTMNYADSVGDLAAKYGVTTDAISEMQYIANQSSTSVETLTNSMSKLYEKAKQDGDIFKELGVSIKDNNGNFKAMDDLFYETIGVLNEFEDDAEKSAYMLGLFGGEGMAIGEVLRKNTKEITAMRKEAHELGIVMQEDTINFASDMNDKMAVLKLQGQSALASLVAGDKDAEEKLQNFFDNLMDFLDSYIPTLTNFGVRLLVQVAIAMVKITPSLTANVIDAVVDTVLNMDWLQVGVDIGLSIAEGVVNTIISALNIVTGIAGVKIPKVDFGVGSDIGTMSLGEMIGEEYEISENINKTIEVKVEASGDSAVSEETAEKTAQALAPYIDKILGGK